MTTLSAVQNVWYQMVGCLVNNELERVCKDVVLGWWEVLY